MSKDQSVYLEERYGRNLPVRSAAAAKRALRRRIAGVLVHDNTEECSGVPLVGGQDVEIGPSSRGIMNVTEDDVYLFPTGMCAIWNAHHLALMTRPAAKSVCFGYDQPYYLFCATSHVFHTDSPTLIPLKYCKNGGRGAIS
jgi:cystathionine gamma-synthase